ncbi:unnamed protein product [Cuscuta campestris]|uniref:Uncharacterized protein n=2 Tax=Cuscuta sect. Cleistogrammica TaxID=1824901 RepID=A0A484N8M1_9ASTE|nr:unnamed protein product [Cuscuta campestris]
MDYSSARIKNKRRGRGFLRGLLNPVRSCSGRSPSPAAAEERGAAPPPARKVDIRNGNNNLAAVKREKVADGDHDDAAAALPGGGVDDDHDEEVDRRAEKLIASFREKIIRAPSSSKYLKRWMFNLSWMITPSWRTY